MKINHHNYEEYFILYMDNELSSDDRRRVEIFVQQHPDLKEELDLLFQYQLAPDTAIVFKGKEDLMKVNGDTPVTLSNYDEWLVLYADNELTTELKTKVDQFIAANPSIKKEFDLFQRTKLQPEEIVFSDKSILYREEEKVRPVAIRWWRLAAAAVLLLGIGISAALVFNKKPSGEEIVKGTGVEKKVIPDNSVVVAKEGNTPDKKSIAADNNPGTTTKDEKQIKNNTIAVKNNLIRNPLPDRNITPQPVKEETVLVNNNPTNNLPEPLNNPNINKNDASNQAVAIDHTLKEINKQKDALTIPVVTTSNPQPSDIVNASYTTDAELEQAGDKKNKNRGIFRKIARNFEKRTDIDPTDNNRLLVAGLAIRLK
jgi:hypothetical protein